ncbi:unnamed protein product (mitochondrion) [Plasmodiophora brassicae]|uniref:EamA domain-containing protein n=1 Tax=Plasmodiophora brassicae TaxID=37360 RepID=A0A3P3Y712_PLABS|nr:unnamed protein product [Plasmodiophora brassicae]
MQQTVAVDDASLDGSSVSTLASTKASAGRKSHAVGAILLFAVASMFVGSSFLTQVLARPFFVSYFNSSVAMLYIVGWAVRQHIPQKRAGPGTDYRRTIRYAAVFTPVLFAMSITFNWSLDKTSMTNNAIISSMSSIFAIAFSRVMLRTPTDDAARPQSLYGDAGALVSACLSGFYTTYLARQITDESRVDMTLFFGLTGLMCAIAVLPFVVVLQLLGVEPSLALLLNGEDVFWLFVNGILTIASNLVWAKATVLTSPFLATVGLCLTTPLTMAVELVVLGKRFGWLYCTGVAIVVIGYLVSNVQHHADSKDGHGGRRLEEVALDKIDDVAKNIDDSAKTPS